MEQVQDEPTADHHDPHDDHAPSITDEQSTTVRRRFYLLNSKNGKFPLAAGKLAKVAAPVALAALALGTAIPTARIQTDLKRETAKDLAAVGLNPDAYKINYSYRNGEIKGPLPEGMTVEQIENSIDFKGIRKVRFIPTTPAAQIAPPQTDDTVVENTGSPLNPPEIKVDLSSSQVTLSGKVASKAQRDKILAAAQAAFGLQNVEDNIEITDAQTNSEDSQRSSDLAAMFGKLAKAKSFSLETTKSDLTVKGSFPDNDSLLEFSKLVDGGQSSTWKTNLELSTDSTLNAPEAKFQSQGAQIDFTARVGSQDQKALLESTLRDQFKVSLDGTPNSAGTSANSAIDVSAESNPTLDSRVADLNAVLKAVAPAVSSAVGLDRNGNLSVSADFSNTPDSIAASDALQTLLSSGLSSDIVATPNVTISGQKSEGTSAEQLDALTEKLGEIQTEIREKVTFETGNAVLTPEASTTLDKLVEILKSSPIPVVEVQGHTDSQGDDAANLALSQQRADAVARYLTDHGIEAGRITATGYGETQPIAPNETAEGRAANRRVEVIAKPRS